MTSGNDEQQSELQPQSKSQLPQLPHPQLPQHIFRVFFFFKEVLTLDFLFHDFNAFYFPDFSPLFIPIFSIEVFYILSLIWN